VGARRALIAAAVVSAGAVAGFSGCGGDAPAVELPAGPTSQPNIVVVMTDDQTQDSVAVMDRVRAGVGERGATFSESFTHFPLCCPARVTFLTGQYSHNHGVIDNDGPEGGFQAFEDTESIAVWLEDAGYATALVGKYLNGYGADDPIYVPPGWTEWYAAPAETEQDVYDYSLNENGELVAYGRAPGDFKTDVITDLAVDFIDRRAPEDRPFFLFTSYTAVHKAGPDPSPRRPRDCHHTSKPAPRHARALPAAELPRPPSFNEADVSDKPRAIAQKPRLSEADERDLERIYRCRLRSLLSVDEGVARMIAHLRRAGELDETYFFFTSDGGFLHGEHRAQAGKVKVYEEAIRVPLIVRGPGIEPGSEVGTLVNTADLAPTIAGLAGAEPGLEPDGASLLDAIEDPDALGRRTLLIESTGGKVAVRTRRYLYGLRGNEDEELYDLRRDPYELRSLHDDPAYARVRATLAERLERLLQCAGESCRS